MEVAGGGYARVAVTNNLTNFPTAAGGMKNMVTEQLFPISTADWGTIVAMAIFDAAIAGNMLYWNNLVTPQAVPISRVAVFRQNKLMFAED